MEASPEAEQPEAAAAKSALTTDSGLSVLGVLLAAIGGGIGVLSFVAFFGAAILWARMDQAGIPGNEAVAVIPRSVLIATGANFLVPCLIAALAFVALVYLIESGTIFWTTKDLRKAEGKLRQKEEFAEARNEEAAAAARKANEAAELREATEKGTEAEGPSPTVAKAEKTFESAADLQSKTLLSAQKAEKAVIPLKQKAEKARLEAGFEQHRRELRLALTIPLFAISALAALGMTSVGLHLRTLGVLVLLVLILAAICVAVQSRTDSFAWFALTTFIAVWIFSGTLTYLRTVDSPKVEPAAVLRSHGAPVVGFFVAQTSDRVYVGTRNPGGTIRLDAIPRYEVVDLALAELQPLRQARRRARVLALQMCRVARERSREGEDTIVRESAQRAPREKVEGSCTLTDIRRLRDSFEKKAVGPA